MVVGDGTSVDRSEIEVAAVQPKNGGALSRSQLEQIKSKAQLAALLEVGQALASSLDLAAVGQTIIDRATALAALDTGALYLLEDDGLSLAATTPPLPADFPEVFRRTALADHPHIARCLASGATLLLADASTAVLSPQERTICEQRGLRTVLYVPMISASHRVGVMILGTVDRLRQFNESELKLYGCLAAQAALAAANARLYDEAQHSIVALREQIVRREQLEEQLRHAQKMELAGKLAGGVAHDFNNLLSVVVAQASYIASELGDHPLTSELDDIITATERGAALTRQLLAFSSKQKLSPKVVDLTEIIQGLDKMLSRLLDKNIELRVESGSPCHARADVGQIEQVVVNLVINGRDALQGGGCITLATRAVEWRESSSERPAHVPAGRYAVLTVRDTGCGISSETQKRIFEPFFTTKPAGEGTGLGLAQVYGIVTQSGGYITVASEENVGTTFEVILPLVDPPRELR